MTTPEDTTAGRTGEAELLRTLSLAERLMAPREEGGTAALPTAAPPRRTLAKSLRYWLWRAGGRKRPGGDAARLAENYERELAREKARVAELEKLTAQLQRVVQTEVDKLRQKMAEVRPAAPQELDRAQARTAEAEERARLAENKVEMLKEALEITRARAGTAAAAPPGDHRFREAKRAFARMFHPDHGGRDDADKQRTFLEFWPVLERIERGE